MNKDDFKKQLLETQIYNELKDSAITGANYIRNKWEGLDIDYSKVYRKIVNYQVKKYGASLTIASKKYTGISKEEAKQITIRRNHRKAYWRNYEHKRRKDICDKSDNN